MKNFLDGLLKKLDKENVPCFIFMIKDKNNKPKFLEVMIKRPYRYTIKGIVKKVPKKYKGIRVKVV